VNLDTTESDLSAISREELDGEVFPGIKIRYEEHWQTASDESTVPPSLRPANVAVPLLTGVLGLLLLETLVAWGFGHHRA
jgi:hypothetical protein